MFSVLNWWYHHKVMPITLTTICKDGGERWCMNAIMDTASPRIQESMRESVKRMEHGLDNLQFVLVSPSSITLIGY